MKTTMMRIMLPAACALALMAGPVLAQTSGVGAASGAPAAQHPAAPPGAAPAGTASGTGGAGVAAAAGEPAAKPAVASTAAKTGSHSRLPASEVFKTAAAATAHCPNDTVVWSTMSKSKSYHLASSKYYGKTRHGAYACEKDVTAAGFHQAKT